MGFMDLFVERSDEEKNKAKENKAVPEAAVIPPVVAVADIASTANFTGLADPKFTNFFSAVYTDTQDIPAPNYYTYKQKLASIAATAGALTEEQRYQMVFAMMATDGVTKEGIIDTANLFVTKLASLHEEAKQGFDDRRQTEVVARETKVATVKQTIADKVATIEKLSKEIAEHQSEITGIQGEIATQSSKIEQNFKNFEASYNQVLGTLQGDIVKIQTIIQ